MILLLYGSSNGNLLSFLIHIEMYIFSLDTWQFSTDGEAISVLDYIDTRTIEKVWAPDLTGRSLGSSLSGNLVVLAGIHLRFREAEQRRVVEWVESEEGHV